MFLVLSGSISMNVLAHTLSTLCEVVDASKNLMPE
jgi:hypothetical protein